MHHQGPAARPGGRWGQPGLWPTLPPLAEPFLSVGSGDAGRPCIENDMVCGGASQLRVVVSGFVWWERGRLTHRQVGTGAGLGPTCWRHVRQHRSAGLFLSTLPPSGGQVAPASSRPREWPFAPAPSAADRVSGRWSSVAGRVRQQPVPVTVPGSVHITDLPHSVARPTSQPKGYARVPGNHEQIMPATPVHGTRFPTCMCTGRRWWASVGTREPR